MKEKQILKFHKLIKKLVDTQKKDALRGLLAEMDSVEIADSLIQLKLAYQVGVLEALETEQVSEIMALLHHSPVLQAMIQHMKTEELGSIVEEMPRDNAADFVSIMEEDKAAEVLEHLPQKDRHEITNLMQYNEESAGGIMDSHLVTATSVQTVYQAVQSIKKYISENENIGRFYSIYVVDEYRHLIGTVEASQLLLADNNRLISELMDPNVVAVDVDLDQEEVAKVARQYDKVVVPVIDKHLRLIGRVTIDDLVDVLSDEYEEDMGMFAGTGDEEVMDISLFKTVRDRLPWLILALFGGAMAAVVMKLYELPLSAMPEVAYFVPLIAALGGNIGIQSSSIVVRGLATGEIRATDLFVRLWRELRVGFINGIACGGLLIFIAWGLTGRLGFGLSTGLSLQIVVCMAAAIGAAMPILLKRFNVDPALATGPFITTANDVLGVVIYLVISFNFSHYLEF